MKGGIELIGSILRGNDFPREVDCEQFCELIKLKFANERSCELKEPWFLTFIYFYSL